MVGCNMVYRLYWPLHKIVCGIDRGGGFGGMPYICWWLKAAFEGDGSGCLTAKTKYKVQ